MNRAGFADRNQLKNWANTVGAQSELPRLVRRLILETTPGLIQLGMPAGEGVSAGGWDGTVRATVATPWVPLGLSVWELSVNSSPGTKADEDYGKRIATPDGSATSSCTYVQAILRPWTKRDAWATTRTSERRWSEVKALGLDDIEAWIESAPVTWAWFSEELGLTPYGLRSSESWWDSWARATVPSLTPEIVVGGRGDQAAALTSFLEGPPGSVSVGAASVDEAQAFVAATAKQASEAGRNYQARMAFVSGRETWARLMDTTTPLILVATEASLARETQGSSLHHVVIPARDIGATADISLPPADAGIVAETFEAAGSPRDESRDRGQLARRSLTALRRSLASQRSLHVPLWAEGVVPRLVRSLLMVGSWSDTSDAEHAIISKLTGLEREQLEGELPQLTIPEDPLLIRVLNSIHLVSPVDSWMLLAPHLVEADLRRLSEAVEAVLSEVDPRLSLPPDERWTAAIHGHSPQFGGTIRTGLARTLVLLAVNGRAVTTASGAGADWADGMIRKLLGTANADTSGELWSSLSDVLPLLAEAAPAVFVEAVSTGLSGEQPILGSMFHEEGENSTLSGSSPHVGLVWALECIAWSTAHFGAAVNLLAKLDRVDPGGRNGPRPEGSLAAILCPWHPKNAASLEGRLQAIDGVRNRLPDAGWKLVVGLLPEMHATHLGTHAPVYRDWKPATNSVPIAEYDSFITALVSRAIEDVGQDPDRWIAILEKLSHLAEPDRFKVLEALEEALDKSEFAVEEGASFWQRISDLIRRHREFKDAAWVLSADVLSRLDAISDKLTPESDFLVNRWLFAQMPDLGDIVRRGARDKYDDELAKRRATAVGSIFAEGGLGLLLRLASETENGCAVGVSIHSAIDADLTSEVLPLLESEHNTDESTALGFFYRHFKLGGWDWFNELIDRHDPTHTQLAAILSVTGEHPRSWEVADEIGVAAAGEFWRRFSPFGLGHDFAHVEDAAKRLIVAGRVAIALDLMSTYITGGRLETDSAAEIVAAALETMAAADEADPEQGALQGYDYKRLFELLESRRDAVGVERVARLEWLFLPALGYDPSVPTLHERMAVDASFFAEVLLAVFPEKVDQERYGETDNDRRQREQRGSNGYRLLSSWRTPPGMSSQQDLDADSLRSWISELRSELDGKGRTEVGLSYLGHVLVSAPADADGLWPPLVVRDLLEELEGDEVASGFEVEISNRRGTTIRGLEDGGSQERKLVAKYLSDAEVFADRWPRTAALLRSVAKGYEREARRNDGSAEGFRTGLHDWH